MDTIGAFEAKTRLSSLLERVTRGERFTITRHGKPIAQLIPVEQHDATAIKAAVARMRELSAGLALGGDWREFRDAGRKW
jgi:prevent-host-death family protein